LADNDGYAFNALEGKGQLDFKYGDLKVDFSSQLSLRYRNYDDTYPGTNQTRKDKRLSLSVAANIPLVWDWFSLGLEILTEKNSSNIGIFDFNNSAFGIHFEILFV